MINAKEEFLKHVGTRTILCADVSQEDWSGKREAEYKLKVGHTPSDYAHFLSGLDFTYDNGYGRQELFGTIWYTDGTWTMYHLVYR